MNHIAHRKIDPHLQLIGMLYLALNLLRKEGNLALEPHLDKLQESKVFGALGDYDRTNQVVYDFACDVFRLFVGGYADPGQIARYMDAYRTTTILVGEQVSMFEVTRLVLTAMLEDYPPAIAAEFGRQAVPPAIKPSFKQLEEFITTINSEPKVDFQTKLDSFFDAIGAPGAVIDLQWKLPTNWENALSWSNIDLPGNGRIIKLRAGAECGDSNCQNLLGILYLSGTGVPFNMIAGQALLELAAEAGDKNAAENLNLSINGGGKAAGVEKLAKQMSKQGKFLEVLDKFVADRESKRKPRKPKG